MRGIKLIQSFVLITLTSIQSLQAQSPFSANASLDINYFNALHLVHGDMWWDPSVSNPSCEYPKGSNKHANFMGAIWMSGVDNANNIHAAAAMYRIGLDYWPGPLDAMGTTNLTTSSNWAKIWKVNAQTIVDFRTTYASLGASGVTATKFDVIKEWPATGNIYAKGNAGSALPELLATGIAAQYFAPFVDVNSDGIYKWTDGDYPDIKGDQMLWWVFNDNGPLHNETKGLPFKMEYHAMAYGYNRGSAVDRMMFYEFTMFNKSVEKYNQFRFGLFSDADLGSPMDDYIAFDSVHRMAIEYNQQLPDAPNGLNSYGSHPPITGLTFIEMPGDVYPTTIMPAGTFNFFNNTSVGHWANPRIDTQYFHLMHAKGVDGVPRYFGNYAYPISKGALMCDSAYPSADRRYLITSNDYGFQPNTKTKIAMAFIATDTNGLACGSINFKDITDLADTAWKIYYHPLAPLSATTILENPQATFKIYPNPAKNSVYVQFNAQLATSVKIKVYDALGRSIDVPYQNSGLGYEMNISTLAPGLYSVMLIDGMNTYTQNFLKQ